MSKAEKENRINSLAVTFLERQLIIPHPFAEWIISAYREGYRQAEKDLELTVDDIKNIDKLLNQCVDYSNPYQEVLKRFKKGKINANKT